ncbi:type IV pilus biogenesis/stability protein PilW [Maritimibacter sp. HL-12]|uniref:tetratricopeptide repeat protein n=1 Tax=Maritimibacter sp. HL-12 TaxID=1162418 RepID=UPI00111BE08F|nr:hypothetical protein [Maritimibacter sp. HL-12]
MRRSIAGYVSGFVVMVMTSAVPASAEALSEAISTTVTALAERFPTGEADGLAKALAEVPDGVSGDTLGHLLYARRHFDKAAWFFGTDAAGDPADPASLNNFAAMLVELHRNDPEAYPVAWVDVARMAAQEASRINPQEAAFRNTLGLAALALGDTTAATKDLLLATAFAPGEPLYFANLARALAAAGIPKAAAEALAVAHDLEPNGLPVLTAVAQLPAIGAPYREKLARSCDVDFRCQEICPKSIIGGLMSVTCEMENASAQMACQAGDPYPTGYDCAEDFPDYGIMIPGLNAGFSFGVPGFSAHVKVNGDGSMDVRVEAGPSLGPVTPYLTADGHFSPDGGASFDNFGGGVRLGLTTGGSAAGELASGLGHPPAHIEIEQKGDGPATMGIEAYNAGVLSI